MVDVDDGTVVAVVVVDPRLVEVVDPEPGWVVEVDPGATVDDVVEVEGSSARPLGRRARPGKAVTAEKSPSSRPSSTACMKRRKIVAGNEPPSTPPGRPWTFTSRLAVAPCG